MGIKYNSERPLKMCGKCGEMTNVYTIEDNCPYCNDCKPQEKTRKRKVMNEKQMTEKILQNTLI